MITVTEEFSSHLCCDGKTFISRNDFVVKLCMCCRLDGKHVVFGQVIEGMDIVRKMEVCRRDVE